MKHLMIDLETLALAPDAVVLSIGALVFTQEKNIETHHTSLSIQDQLNIERRINAGTLQWWMGQPDHTRKRAFEKPVAFEEGIKEFFSFARSHNPERVWANGTDFDISILAHCAAQLGLQLPWKYYIVRDVRTIRDFIDPAKLPENKNAHDAVADCEFQAEIVRAVLGKCTVY